MSFSNEPTAHLFSFDVGTSFAAPLVAQTAARVWNKLQIQFPEVEVHPNLVRALLSVSADYTQITTNRIDTLSSDLNARHRICGYGMIDEDFVMESSDRRVTLLNQHRMKIDSFHIYEIPIPPAFYQARGEKKIIVGLAFDPPVRRRRSEYLGVKMRSYLIRGKTLSEVVEAYSDASAQSDEPPPSIQGKYRCNLQPGVQKLNGSTLQRSEWSFSRSAYGETYYLVVRSQRIWAPAEIEEQDYAVAVSLIADEPELYAKIEQRVQARIEQEIRIRPRS